MHDGPRLNAYDDGPLDVYLNCQASSYARMLQNRRLDPRILGDQWIYSYVRQPEAPYNSASFMHRNYPTVIRDWYGVEENVNHHDNANNALTYARQIIAEGALPAVYVDLFCYSRETFFSGRSHQPRSIILAGQRKDEFLVWDGMGVGRFVGWMPASDIATAMDSGHLESGHWGFNARNTTRDLPAPPGGKTQPGIEHIRAVLSATAEGFLFVTPATGQQAVGPGAIKKAMEDLLATSELGEVTTDRDDFVSGIANLLGGISSHRQLNVMFLELSAERLSADFTPTLECFRHAAREWFKIFNIFLFGARANWDRKALVTEVSKRAFGLLEAERQGTLALLTSLHDAAG